MRFRTILVSFVMSVALMSCYPDFQDPVAALAETPSLKEVNMPTEREYQQEMENRGMDSKDAEKAAEQLKSVEEAQKSNK